MNLRKDHYRCQAKALLWLTRYHRPCRGGSPRVPLGRAAELPRHVLSVRRVQGRVLGEAPPAWPGRVPIEWGQVCLGNTSFRSGYLALPGHMLLGPAEGRSGPMARLGLKSTASPLFRGPPQPSLDGRRALCSRKTHPPAVFSQHRPDRVSLLLFLQHYCKKTVASPWPDHGTETMPQTNSKRWITRLACR